MTKNYFSYLSAFLSKVFFLLKKLKCNSKLSSITDLAVRIPWTLRGMTHFDAAINRHPGVSQAERGVNVCAVQLKDVKPDGAHVCQDWSLLDVKYGTVSFTKSRQVITGDLNKLQDPITFSQTSGLASRFVKEVGQKNVPRLTAQESRLDAAVKHTEVADKNISIDKNMKYI